MNYGNRLSNSECSLGYRSRQRRLRLTPEVPGGAPVRSPERACVPGRLPAMPVASRAAVVCGTEGSRVEREAGM